jgi:DNA repair protein RadC
LGNFFNNKSSLIEYLRHQLTGLREQTFSALFPNLNGQIILQKDATTHIIKWSKLYKPVDLVLLAAVSSLR